MVLSRSYLVRAATGGVLAVLSTVTLVGAVPAASGAVPRPGDYASPNPPPYRAEHITFGVKDGRTMKVQDFTLYSYSCGVISVGRGIKISNKGKFKFDGAAHDPGGAAYDMKVVGRFTKAQKAEVKVTWDDRVAEGCTVGGTLEFVAKRA
jgi:hypothetical protein